MWVSAVIGDPGVNDDRQFRTAGRWSTAAGSTSAISRTPASWALSNAVFSRSSNDRYRRDDGLPLTDGMRHCGRPPCRSRNTSAIRCCDDHWNRPALPRAVGPRS